MPRKKEYKREELLDKAIAVFWRKGYEGTSMQDLVESTGVNRFGIYSEFGNKDGLFVKALERYRDKASELLLKPLELSGLQGLWRFFDVLESIPGNSGDGLGCLLTNTIVDLPERNEEVRSLVRETFQAIEKALCDCFAAALDKDEIAGHAAEELAAYMLGVIQGFMTLNRCEKSRARALAFLRLSRSFIESLQQSPKEVVH